jgi:hypothetical protein
MERLGTNLKETFDIIYLKGRRKIMKNNKIFMVLCCLGSMLLTNAVWAEREYPLPIRQYQTGSQWEGQRLVTSKPGRYEIVDSYKATSLANCEAQFAADNQEWSGKYGVRCVLADYCDANNDNHPQMSEIRAAWDWHYYILYSNNIPCGPRYNAPRKEDGCACVVHHGPYIDGAQENDILFYPTAGLDWAGASETQERNYHVATAFFTELWPQYGLNSPFHVAYCYEGMSFSQHDNEIISKPRNQTTNDDLGNVPFWNPGSICTEIFDNRAVINLEGWEMDCPACNNWADIGDCCCPLIWVDRRDWDNINVAHEMMNMGGDYYVPRYRPTTTEGRFYGNFAVPKTKVTAGTGIRDEHNWSSVGGVWAYATNTSVINPSQLQARRDKMWDVAGKSGQDPDAPYDYNFGGYTEYVKQSGCSQTMGDTLHAVGQLTICQGYNATYVPECVLEGMSYALFDDFYQFCANIEGLNDVQTVLCTDQQDENYCKRMASSITFGFMNIDRLDQGVWNDHLQITMPPPKVVSGVTSPADLWDRLFSLPGDMCGPLMTGDPAFFEIYDENDNPINCSGIVGKRCQCNYGSGYCWCNTEFDNWCELEWYNNCDGCDEGCQFLGGIPPDGNPSGDPDCFSQDSNCRDANPSHGKPVPCGNGRCDAHAGESYDNCPDDCYVMALEQCCFDNCATTCRNSPSVWVTTADYFGCMHTCGEAYCSWLEGNEACDTVGNIGYCGDGECSYLKNCDNCPWDCPTCPPVLPPPHEISLEECCGVECYNDCDQTPELWAVTGNWLDCLYFCSMSMCSSYAQTCDEIVAIIPECGDGGCWGSGENCHNCPQECGDCCGNNMCDWYWGESNDTCPQDCEVCYPNGTCDPVETHSTCPADCPECKIHSDCMDGEPCTDDRCNDGTCTYTAITGSCDDGFDCNGADTCSAGVCVHEYPDRCPTSCNGIVVNSSDYSDIDTVTGEPDNYPPGRCGGPDNGSDFCYSWTPTVSGIHEIDTCNAITNFDTVLTIWDSNGHNVLGCNDNYDLDCGNGGSKIFFDADAGTTYTIVIDGWDLYPECDPPVCYMNFYLDIKPPCTTDADCYDGRWCNGVDSCTSQGYCIHEFPTGNRCENRTDNRLSCDEPDETCRVCNSNNDCDDGNPCTDDSCYGIFEARWCSNQPDYSLNGSSCTTTSGTGTCSNGECDIENPANPVLKSIQFPTLQCTSDDECNDGNVCTDDICDIETGICIKTANTASCSDHLWCTGTDTCSNESCSNHQYPSGNPCPSGESCVEGASSYTCEGGCDPGCGSRECGPDPNGCNTTCGSGCTGDQVCNDGVCEDPSASGCTVISGGGLFQGNTANQSDDYTGTGGNSCDGHPARDYCYEWTPSVSGVHNLSLCNGGTFNDTVLMVWDETSTNQLACDDDGLMLWPVRNTSLLSTAGIWMRMTVWVISTCTLRLREVVRLVVTPTATPEKTALIVPVTVRVREDRSAIMKAVVLPTQMSVVPMAVVVNIRLARQEKAATTAPACLLAVLAVMVVSILVKNAMMATP